MPELVAPPAKNCFSAYGIWLYREKNALIKTIKKTHAPSVHGDRQWNSSFLIMDYFTFRPARKKSRVLDVGCGWGPTSIFMASRGHRVTGLDIDDEVFEFLHAQAALNNVKVASLQGPMKSLRSQQLMDIDLVVGADICFWDELADEWFTFLKRAANAGVKQLVLADPGRAPFFKLADKCIKRWPVEMLEWYALEPRKFSGYLLVVDLAGAN